MKTFFFLIAFLTFFISPSQDLDYRVNTEKYYQSILEIYSQEHETMNFFSDIEGDILYLTSEMKIPIEIERHQIGPGTLAGAKSSFYGIASITLLSTEEDRDIFKNNNFKTVRYKSVMIDPYYNRMVIEMSLDGQYFLKFPLPEYDFINELTIDKTFFNIN